MPVSAKNTIRQITISREMSDEVLAFRQQFVDADRCSDNEIFRRVLQLGLAAAKRGAFRDVLNVPQSSQETMAT